MIFRKISYFAVAGILSCCVWSYEGQAQVFLSDDNEGNGSGNSSSSSIFNFFGGNDTKEDDAGNSRYGNPRSSQNDGTSSFLLPENKEKDYSTYYKDKYRYKSDNLRQRSQRNATHQNGVTYSIEEYNRLLSQQRAGTLNPNAAAAQANQGRSKLMKSNPYTGRFSTKAEIDEMAAKREAYYAAFPDLPRKKRKLGEEIFFNNNGYYRSDKDYVIDGSQASSSRSRGNVTIMNSSKRSTPQRYR